MSSTAPRTDFTLVLRPAPVALATAAPAPSPRQVAEHNRQRDRVLTSLVLGAGRQASSRRRWADYPRELR